MDFIAIDFETTASETNSACSLGIVSVENLCIVKKEYFLIQPPTLLFSKKNVEINGILPEQVKDKPKFPEIWESVKHYFDGSCPIFAHNARFDMSVLMESLSYYGLDFPQFTYSCSIPFSTKVCGGDIPRTLESRAKYFGIQLDDHHNAESDAMACAQIVIETVKKSRWKTFESFCKIHCIEMKNFLALHPQKSLGKTKFEQLDYDHAIASEKPVSSSELSGKIVVITGEFSTYTRKELAQQLFNLNAIVKNGVTKQTDYLIVGTQDKSLVGEDGMSGKEEKAHALIEKGINIRILNESEIRNIILRSEGRAMAV